MLIALAMPQFGESITQGRIVRWLKKEGESLQENEPLIEMETEKAVFSYESPFRGKLIKILQPDDAEVAVGIDIAQFEVSEGDGKKYLSLGVGKEKEAIVSPLIRSLAKEHGIPLEALEGLMGSGPEGRVTKEDFLLFLKKREGRTTAPERTGVKVIPLSPIRSRIADNMVLSKQKIPHAGCSVEVDLARIDSGRTRLTPVPGYLPFAILASIHALKSCPVLNGSWKEAEGRRWIEQYEFVHMGIAVSTEQGLLVPVIRDADKRSFSEICREIDRLVEGGRKGTLKPQDLTGATFTINNAGALGAVRSTQIIPHPQAAILAVNRTVRRPWVVGDDTIQIRPIMGLDLAFDHRMIDGDQAVRFLTVVRENLEKFDFRRL